LSYGRGGVAGDVETAFAGLGPARVSDRIRTGGLQGHNLAL
jgi:hypothetical protein